MSTTTAPHTAPETVTALSTVPLGRVPEPPVPGEEIYFERLSRPPRRKPLPPLLARLILDLDQAQSEWVYAESERTGLDYITLVKQLIDAARAGQTSHAGPE